MYELACDHRRIAGSATSMAGPWADRAIARRTARSERTDLRNNQKQADATYGAGDRANAIAVIVPENTLRPGVVRRLSRRGISVEELNSFTAAGKAEQVAGDEALLTRSIKMATKPKYGRIPVHNLL